MTKKHYKILIPRSVKLDLERQADYIISQRQESSIALKWLDGIIDAVNSLSEFPERFAIAPENSVYAARGAKTVIRNLIYKKSFRVVFAVVGNEVRVLSVRHSARLK